MNALLRASIQIAGFLNTAFCARLNSFVSSALITFFSFGALTGGSPLLSGVSWKKRQISNVPTNPTMPAPRNP